MMQYRPDVPASRDGGSGEIVGGVALGLILGLAWEMLSIWTDWRLGFSPPVWEIVVGWIGLSAFSAFVVLVIALAGLAFYSTSTQMKNPTSYDAKQAVRRARGRAASFAIGLGGLMAFGGGVMWAFSKTGPEFAAYSGFSRFTTVIGAAVTFAAVLYVKKDPETPF